MAVWLASIDKQSWDRDGGSFSGGPPKGVLHTTESSNWPAYAAGGNAPHFSVMPVFDSRRLDIRQHSPLDRAARALMNLSGGVQTNRDSAIQIELVGTCDPSKRGTPMFYWPNADTWALTALAAFMRRLEIETGIARMTVTPWLPYPSSYANRQGQRLTLSQWDNYSGWVGHQHVPENTHGDPGDLNIAALIGTTTLPVVGIQPVRALVLQFTAPRFPLPGGSYFGPKTGPAECVSGYFGANGRDMLRIWQRHVRDRRRLPIDVDGLYGPQTAHAARHIQIGAQLTADELIGPLTWAAAWSPTTTSQEA